MNVIYNRLVSRLSVTRFHERLIPLPVTYGTGVTG